VLVASGAQRADAQPMLRVRSETRVEFSAEQVAGGVQVELALRDDLGAAIAGAELRLTLHDADGSQRTQRVRTGMSGDFAGRLRAPDAVTTVVVRYEGDRTHAGTRAERTLDAMQVSTTLTLESDGGGRLDLDAPSHGFVVGATSDVGGADLRVELLDELDRVLATGRTDVEGHWRVQLPSDALGPVGAGRLTARVAGDLRRADAQVELPVVRMRITHLTLDVAQGPLRPDQAVQIAGRLSDSQAGLGQRAVGLYVGEAHWFTVLTDESGAYATERRLDADDVDLDADPAVQLQARYASEGPGRPDAASEVARRPVEAAVSWAWLALVVPLFLTAAAVLWGARGRRRPPSPERQPARPPASYVEAGRSRGRRRRFHDVGGTVQDGREQDPLAGAKVRAIDESGAAAETLTDPSGRFSFASLPAGASVIEVDAVGYELSRTPLTLPHRGEWSQMSVRLRSLRWQASESFEPVALELVDSAEQAASRTAREVAAVARGAVEADVSALAQAVDRAAYARAIPEREAVRQIGQNADALAERLRSSPDD